MSNPKLTSQILPFNSIYEEAYMRWFDSQDAAPKEKTCGVCGISEHDEEACDIQDGICDECAYTRLCEDEFDSAMDKWLDEEFGK